MPYLTTALSRAAPQQTLINDGDCMIDEKTQQPNGVASDLNAELGVVFALIIKESEKAYYFGFDIDDDSYVKIWFPKSLVFRIDRSNDIVYLSKSLFVKKLYEKLDNATVDKYLKQINT